MFLNQCSTPSQRCHVSPTNVLRPRSNAMFLNQCSTPSQRFQVSPTNVLRQRPHSDFRFPQPMFCVSALTAMSGSSRNNLRQHYHLEFPQQITCFLARFSAPSQRVRVSPAHFLRPHSDVRFHHILLEGALSTIQGFQRFIVKSHTSQTQTTFLKTS